MFNQTSQPHFPSEIITEPFPWLLAYFRQVHGQASPERANQVESLHYAYSWDGVHWTPINQNQPVYIPQIEGRTCSIRNPFIARGPDGVFHMLCTEGPHDWSGKSLLYSRSRDLIHWEASHRIPVMEEVPQARNAWAPEFVFDPAQNDYFVYWVSTLAENASAGKQLWFAHTRDFQTFTSPRPLFDPGLNVTGAHIMVSGGQSYLFYNPDTENSASFMHVAVGDRLEGPYQFVAGGITPAGITPAGITPAASEGPRVMRKSRPAAWYLYYDLATTNRYGLSVSQDLVHWEIASNVSFPEDARHGSFLSIKEDELAALLWRFDFRFLVERRALARPGVQAALFGEDR